MPTGERWWMMHHEHQGFCLLSIHYLSVIYLLSIYYL